MPDSPSDALVPAGFRLKPDLATRLLAGGTVLSGGAPVRLLRLTPAGAKQVAAWWAGAPVPASPNARALARRLLDAGLAHPAPAAHLAPAGSDVTVVIPVRNRVAELESCLAAIDLPVVVVDDASNDQHAAGIAAVAMAARATLLVRPVRGGPGAARNTGFTKVGTALVAFIDSDCVPCPGWLAPLLPHFADPAVAAVAPRIVPHAASCTWLGRFEGSSSTLDLGSRESIVRSGARVPYVPTAALVVRSAAFGGGFTEELQAGEDVDFVWRLAASGWRVRYEPAATVGHRHRTRLRPWFIRRMHYGTSAAVLEQRHPGAVRPLYTSPWTAAAWLAAATAAWLTASATAESDHRGVRGAVPAVIGLAAGGAVTAVAAARLGRHLSAVLGDATPASQAWRLAARLAAGGTVAAARPLGSAISRTWWPLALPAAIAVRRLRLPLAALVLTPPLLDWLDRCPPPGSPDHRPPLDPARHAATHLLGDLAYSLGVWQGCIQRRSFRALFPATRRGRQKASA